MKKTLISIVIILSLVLSLFVTVSANEDITIYVNDEILQCDTAPFIKDGRTMVPMRKIFEALNANVDWDGSTQTITATKDAAQIVLQINNSTMYNNGIEETLDVAPIIVDSSTFVPIRAVAQSLKAFVNWFDHTQTVYINSEKTYNDEYNSFLDFYMQATVPAGYEFFENITDNATLQSDICAQGLISDVQVNGNDIYLIMNNRYSKDERIAIYIGDTESTSFEKITEIFKNKNISVGGRYLGVTAAFNTPAISMQYVSVFESDSRYKIDELIYPKLSLLGQTVTLYNQENQPQDVLATQVNDYLEAGWTSEAQVTMYAPNGRTTVVANSDVSEYQNVGWYLYPVTTMYALDGRSTVVADSEISAYQNVGWYLNPVTTMYAPDGRTAVVDKNEIYDYMNVGWYKTYEEAQAANTPSNSKNNNYSYNSGSVNNPNSGGSAVYRTPSGTKYHFDPDCGGKNSYQTTLDKAKRAGLTPCKKCAW